jgi:hypothetical protein
MEGENGIQKEAMSVSVGLAMPRAICSQLSVALQVWGLFVLDYAVLLISKRAEWAQ